MRHDHEKAPDRNYHRDARGLDLERNCQGGNALSGMFGVSDVATIRSRLAVWITHARDFLPGQCQSNPFHRDKTRDAVGVPRLTAPVTCLRNR